MSKESRVFFRDAIASLPHFALQERPGYRGEISLDMNVVRLKRDVRLHDHEPLALAAALPEPLLLLYVYEPCHLQSDSYHEAHHVFINEGLADLDGRVRTIASGDDGGLTLRLGDAVEVLAALHALLPIKRLLSHCEVGNAISRARNARVSEWAGAHGVS